MVRVGLVGFGFIGAELYRAIAGGESEGLEIAFVWNRSADKLGGVPKNLVLDNLADFAQLSPDLIVEAAHPDISRAHAAAFLQSCDYMPASVTALADDALRERLVATAERSGHRLIIPRGALVGADALIAWRHMWRDVTSRFANTPTTSILPPEWRAQDITRETVIFDGPVRQIAPLFPATSTRW
jgi:aspartate dehydrogenase